MKQLLKNLWLRFKWRGKARIPLSSVVGLSSRFEGANALGPGVKYKGSLGYGSYVGHWSRLVADVGRFSSIGPSVRTSPFLHPFRAPYVSSSPMFFSTRKQNGHTFATRQTFTEVRYTDPARRIAVSIGNDCWIGEEAFLAGGVTIGDGAVVMARAVVTKDVPPYAIVGGVPAKVIGYRFDPDTIEWLLRVKWWDRPVEWLAQNWEKFNDIDSLKEVLKYPVPVIP